MKPAWFKLLLEWQDAGRFGLTLPFVYGALDQAPEGSLRGATSAEKLKFLLASLVDDVLDGALVRLFFCSTVQDLTLAPVFAVPGHCRAIAKSDGGKAGFFAQQDLLPEKSSSEIADLHAELWQRYGDVLKAGRFSLRNGTFAAFSDRDLALINAALLRPDDDQV